MNPILKVACVNLVMSWTTAILHLFSQETDLLMKVIMKFLNIKLWDLLGCFHYILNAPRILYIHVHTFRHAVKFFFGNHINRSTLLAVCFTCKRNNNEANIT